MKSINQIIKDTAENCIGLEEIRGNMGFKDISFDIRMKSVGHLKGQAWCAYFAELVWKEAYQQYNAHLFDELDKLFNASAVLTWRNFKLSMDFIHSEVPKVGGLIIWQNYRNEKRHWTGHIGIVTGVFNGFVTAVEGNTNDDGSREGFKVAVKKRLVDFKVPKNGLKLLGFIHPKE